MLLPLVLLVVPWALLPVVLLVVPWVLLAVPVVLAVHLPWWMLPAVWLGLLLILVLQRAGLVPLERLSAVRVLV